MLLRVAYGKSLNEIADVFQVSRDTVSKWLQRFEKKGVQGLADKPRPGAAAKLDATEQALILEISSNYPRRPSEVLDEFERRTSKRISVSTLKRLVRKSKRFRPGKPK
ncbi:MAG: helix-turn-helix domain-containing protein [Pirellulaceae bacterium]